MYNVRRTGNYALLECNWGPDYKDPQTYTDPFTSDGNYNWPHLAKGYIESNGKSIYENVIDNAKMEVMDKKRRYNLFAEAEAFFIDQAFIIPYGLGGGGYSASRLNPFESPYSPFGTSNSRYKGQRIMEKSMNTKEFYEAFERWERERAEALKKAAGNNP